MKKRHPHKHNVLLVNITRLGDMLQATPTIAGMKMENPDCRITVVVEKQFDQVLRNIPNIDEIVSIDLGMTVRSLAREGEGAEPGGEQRRQGGGEVEALAAGDAQARALAPRRQPGEERGEEPEGGIEERLAP